MRPRLELRKWAQTGDTVLFHIYIGEGRVGTGTMRSRDWFEVQRGNVELKIMTDVRERT